MESLRRTGERIGILCSTCIVIVMSIQPTVVAATPVSVTIQPTPPPNNAPALIITSIVGSSLPNYLELYNQSDGPINLADWQAGFTIHDDTTDGCADLTPTISLPAAWLLPKKYLTLERTVVANPGSLSTPFVIDTNILTGCTAPKLAALALARSNDAAEQTVTIPSSEWSAANVLAVQHKQRSNSPNSSRTLTNVFDTDYKFVTGAIALNSDPLYLPPPDNASLQILEILPNARSCSPTESDLACNDYVKLYNPTDLPINLALYRLRIGYKGQSESVANTFTWGRSLDPGADELILQPQTYLMLTTRNDGQPLSITDSGNYVWLEDSYGTAMYDPVVQYPDASSQTKAGQAWAYDGAIWQWTSMPQPNAPNYFPPVVVPQSQGTPVIDVLKPCPADQYRNPTTNRCKSITVAAPTLVPCGPGEERNPDTNRCRSNVAAAAVLTPCSVGQERNPDTNRCRKIAAAVAGASTTTVKDVAAASTSSAGWFIAILAIGLAMGYAIYEWRQELYLGYRHARDNIAHRFRSRT